MKSPRVLLIIPAFNEEKSIKNTLSLVKSSKYDYIVINDGSSDNTEKVLNDIHANYINLCFNLGIGGAVQTGYKYALENNYDIAIQFDADGQHNIDYVNNLIEPIINNKADLVIGSCFIDKNLKNKRSSTIRRLGIKFLSKVIFLFSGKHIYDPTSGFRAINSKIIYNFAKKYPQEYPEPISNFEILKYSNFKVKEVPVTMNKRKAGKSSIHSWKSIYAAFNVLLSIILISFRRKKHD
ncbi:glycosyltransferase family 2 protein [Candidatus Saccharibacteria bacterium]|nr:glycosyltransferase family 2 protein [Candidatus Saccharibacteria bacterium]